MPESGSAAKPSTVEPPYGVIWSSIKQEKVVPFLGAGASFVGRDKDAIWNSANPAFLPSGRELAHFLADEASYPSSEERDRDDLAKVASYYADVSGRPNLRSVLRTLLKRPQPYIPGPIHELLASLDVPQVIVSTNYDTLLEQAFDAVGKPYDLVIYPADLKRKDIANAVLWFRHGATRPETPPANELHIDLKQTTVIYKMHGSVMRNMDDYDGFVITEEDYIEFLSRMTTSTAIPSLFTPYFSERSFLFLGYSLQDWNLRVVLRNISKFLKNRAAGDDEDEVLPSWAIQYPVSQLDRELWGRRKVNIYESKIDDFAARLKKRREV